MGKLKLTALSLVVLALTGLAVWADGPKKKKKKKSAPALTPRERVWVGPRYRKAKWTSRGKKLQTREEKWYTSAPKTEVKASVGELVIGVVPIGDHNLLVDAYRVISIEGGTATLENYYGRVTGVPGIFIHPLIGIAKRVNGSVSAGVPVVQVKGQGYYDGLNLLVVARVAKGVPSSFPSSYEGQNDLDELDGVAFPLPPQGLFSRVAFAKLEEWGTPVGIVVAKHGKRTWIRRYKASGASDIIVVKETRLVQEKAKFRKGEWVYTHQFKEWRAEQVSQVVKTGFYCVGKSTNPLRWAEVFAFHPGTGKRPGPPEKKKKKKKKKKR